MQNLKTDLSYDHLNCVLLHAIDTYLLEKSITILYKNVIRQLLMISALLNKMYRKASENKRTVIF